MYNFKMSKSRQEKLMNECNFNEIEKCIFNNLVLEKSRLEVYDIIKQKYGCSISTTNRIIKKIINKINNYDYSDDSKYKIYIHKFPNGKKYVGVCQCCEDRWNNGNGYANNKEMYEDIKKYGWENIEHKVLYEISDSKIAYDIEHILINELELIKNGYNRE